MDSRVVGLWNSPLQRAENSGAEAFVSLRDEHLEAADGLNQLGVSLFQVLQLGRTFRSTRTQTWWGNQEKQVRRCPPALSPRLRSTDCFCCLRQTEKPEADGQDAHFQAQGSHSDRQAHQAGAATNQHRRSHHGRYEAPSPDRTSGNSGLDVCKNFPPCFCSKSSGILGRLGALQTAAVLRPRRSGKEAIRG